MVRPKGLAVCRLRTNSNFAARSTGISATGAPFKIFNMGCHAEIKIELFLPERGKAANDRKFSLSADRFHSAVEREPDDRISIKL